jgi:hypothetical protein
VSIKLRIHTLCLCTYVTTDVSTVSRRKARPCRISVKALDCVGYRVHNYRARGEGLNNIRKLEGIVPSRWRFEAWHMKKQTRAETRNPRLLILPLISLPFPSSCCLLFSSLLPASKMSFLSSSIPSIACLFVYHAFPSCFTGFGKTTRLRF